METIRVGCIISADSEEVKFLGYGEYAGNEVPSAEAVGLCHILRVTGRSSPKIVLDSGEVVYGCECWWVPEDIVKSAFSQRKIVTVSINECRARARKISQGAAVKPLRDQLEKDGYDGLCYPELECGCGLNDLVPCGELNENCQPAYKHADELFYPHPEEKERVDT